MSGGALEVVPVVVAVVLQTELAQFDKQCYLTKKQCVPARNTLFIDITVFVF